jgi:hypothetical protein
MAIQSPSQSPLENHLLKITVKIAIVITTCHHKNTTSTGLHRATFEELRGPLRKGKLQAPQRGFLDGRFCTMGVVWQIWILFMASGMFFGVIIVMV